MFITVNENGKIISFSNVQFDPAAIEVPDLDVTNLNHYKVVGGMLYYDIDAITLNHRAEAAQYEEMIDPSDAAAWAQKKVARENRDYENETRDEIERNVGDLPNLFADMTNVLFFLAQAQLDMWDNLPVDVKALNPNAARYDAFSAAVKAAQLGVDMYPDKDAKMMQILARQEVIAGFLKSYLDKKIAG